jgi:hypothetical protein
MHRQVTTNEREVYLVVLLMVAYEPQLVKSQHHFIFHPPLKRTTHEVINTKTFVQLIVFYQR